MKDFFMALAFQAGSIACIVFAGLLLLNGVEHGWGWLLVVACLLAGTYRTKDNASAKLEAFTAGHLSGVKGEPLNSSWVSYNDDLGDKDS